MNRQKREHENHKMGRRNKNHGLPPLVAGQSQNESSLASLILSILFRFLGGVAGTAILLLFFNWIFIEGKGMPTGGGYYGPVVFPLGLYMAIAFIAYAVGGQKLLRKITPGWADKRGEASQHSEMHQEHDEFKK